jgi:hypothetical protein
MHFRSETHKQKYETNLKRDKTRPDDYERQAMFFILSLEPFSTRIDDLYDFEDHSIRLYKSGNVIDQIEEKTACVDFSSSERVMLTCAYYLYNCYTDKFLTLSNLFGFGDDSSQIIMSALHIRYRFKLSV